MEKERNGLDNFFRENLSDFGLSGKRGNWELLNHLLNEQERKRKKRRWFIFIFCFIVIISSGLLVMLPGKKVNQMTTDKTEPSNTSVAIESGSSQNEAYNSTSAIPSENNRILKNTDSNIQPAKPEHSSYIPEEKNNPYNPVMNNEGSQQGVTHNGVSQHSTAIKPEINFTSHQPDVTINDSDKTVIGETKYADSFAADYAHQNDSANQTSISADTLIIKTPSNDSLTAITATNSPVDSVITKEMIPDKAGPLYFNFYAGLNMYSTGSAFTDHQNFSPIAGFELVHPVNSDFSIGLTGLYSLQGGYHLNDTATITQETYFLDADVNISQQTIQIRKMHKLYFPLTFYYSFAKKHSLLGAVQLSCLVNTNGYYTEMNTTSGVTTKTEKNNVSGYMDGIKPFNFAASFGYQFSVSKKFAFSTRITRELTEAYSREYFNDINKSPSWSVQTFLLVKF